MIEHLFASDIAIEEGEAMTLDISGRCIRHSRRFTALPQTLARAGGRPKGL